MELPPFRMRPYPRAAALKVVRQRTSEADFAHFFFFALLGVSMALGLLPRSAEAQSQPSPLIVFAAGSLRPAMSDIAALYKARVPDAPEIKIDYESAGTLTDRIEKGEPAQVLASADMVHPQKLAAEGKARPAMLFARNRMCLMLKPGVSAAPDTVLERLLDPNLTLATSTPHADPGGDYAFAIFAKADALHPGAKATLEAKAQQLIGGPQSPPVPAGRNPVAWHISEGHAALFLAYCSAGTSAQKQLPGLSVVRMPPSLDIEADYGMAILTGDSAGKAAAEGFARFILSPEAQAVLVKYGFAPAQGDG